jgi:hypothetical protein
MADASQGQSVGDIDAQAGGVQIGQAQGDVINAQNSQIIKISYYSLFGGPSVAPGIDWERAMQILKQEMQPEIKKRLKDSLSGLADVDAIEVKPVRQEDSPVLGLEAVKTLMIDGTQAGTIDPHRPMIETYAREDIKGKLLILGTPGAGKTITLLRLTEQLVGEAIAQPKTVIPIVFELSTWRHGQAIEAWLIEQLYENYGGNRKRKIYETWLERRVLLPLLDGLDELGMVRQQACTEKVNDFARTYPYLVVCCRVKEFQEAGVNLADLRGKVQLQPLSDDQIQSYLQLIGKSGLWEQIHTVSEMGRLLLPVINLDKQIQEYLFRREKLKLWEDAIQAVQEIQQTFPSVLDLADASLLEQLERQIWISLSSKGKESLWYSILEVEKEIQQFLDLIASDPERFIEPGLLRIPLFIGITAKIYHPKDSLRNKEELFKYYLENQLSRDVRENDRRRGMGSRKWAFKAVEKEPTREEVQHSLVWLAKQMRKHNQVDLLVKQMQPSWIANSKSKRIYQLIGGLIAGLIFGGFIGLSRGIWWGLIGVLFFLLYAFRGGLDEIVSSENSTLVDGMGNIDIINVLYAVLAPMQYLCLRLVLTFSERVIPWDLARFLTYCHERRLLQQIGGRYRFIHRELLDHFAAMEE